MPAASVLVVETPPQPSYRLFSARSSVSVCSLLRIANIGMNGILYNSAVPTSTPLTFESQLKAKRILLSILCCDSTDPISTKKDAGKLFCILLLANRNTRSVSLRNPLPQREALKPPSIASTTNAFATFPERMRQVISIILSL